MKLTKLFIPALVLLFLMITPETAFAHHGSNEMERGKYKKTESVDSTKAHNMHCWMKTHGNHSDAMEKKDIDSSVIREGEIDLSAIDENKDGKVYQDLMDWNVLSDKSGVCPLCSMKLEEVSLEEAKENLLKHNFKIRELYQ